MEKYTREYFNNKHEAKFLQRSKDEKWNVLDTLDGCDLRVGDIVTYTNDYGVTFEGMKVLGFCTPTIWGGCVYLNTDAYWFPHTVNSLQKTS